MRDLATTAVADEPHERTIARDVPEGIDRPVPRDELEITAGSARSTRDIAIFATSVVLQREVIGRAIGR